MDPFDPVLGGRRGRGVAGPHTPSPVGLLLRLDALCADFAAAADLSDALVALLTTGRGFRSVAHGADDYLLTDYVGGWAAALLHFDGERWRAYVSRELVSGLRPVSA